MKVLLLAGANSAHTQRWANALSRRGIDLVVATQHGFEARDFDASVRVLRLPFRGGAGYVLNAPALRAILRREWPDILHAHYASGYGTTARLSGFHPAIVSAWGSDIFEFPKRGMMQRNLVTQNLRAADWIMSTSAVMKREIESYLSPRREILLTPFGVETGVFVPAGRSERSGQLTLGVIKDLEWYCGIDTLLRAFARLLKDSARQGREEGLRLRIAGDGPRRAELEGLAAELGLGDSVEFLGFLRFADVPAFMASLDIYCAPSLAESFGVAVLEASSCELPVVASRVGGLPEVVDEGRTGFLVPPGDEEALAEALEKLVGQATLRRTLGEAGRAFVMERYEWESCVDRVATAYEELAAAERRR